jgi:hypothetical protein
MPLELTLIVEEDEWGGREKAETPLLTGQSQYASITVQRQAQNHQLQSFCSPVAENCIALAVFLKNVASSVTYLEI